MKKRVFGLFAAIVMLFCLLPGVALADGDETVYLLWQGTDGNIYYGTTYDEDNPNNGTKLVLSDIDYELNGNYQLRSNITIPLTSDATGLYFEVGTATIDLNGYTITEKNGSQVFSVNKNGSLTLKDTRGTGTVESKGIAIFCGDGSSFTLDGCTISNSACGIDGEYGTSYITINSGTITNCKTGIVTGINSHSTLTINGGEINCTGEGQTAIEILDGTLYANGGSVRGVVKNVGTIKSNTATGTTDFYGTVENGAYIEKELSYSKGTINAGNYYGTVNNNIFKNYEGNFLQSIISGGTFYGEVNNKVEDTSNTPAIIKGGVFAAGSTVNNEGTIEGGTFYGRITGSGMASGHTVIQAPATDNTATTFHTVRATAGAGGSLSESIVSLRPGESFTFEFTPDAGYAVADVRVDGKSVGAVESYTFRNLSADRTLEVEFAPVGATGTPADADKNPNTGAQSALGAAAALAALSLLAAAAAAQKQQ